MAYIELGISCMHFASMDFINFYKRHSIRMCTSALVVNCLPHGIEGDFGGIFLSVADPWFDFSMPADDDDNFPVLLLEAGKF